MLGCLAQLWRLLLHGEPRYGVERLVNIYAFLRTGEENLEVVLSRERLRLLLTNLPVILEVALSRDHDSEDVLVRVLLDLRKPVRHVVEGGLARRIEGQDYAVCALVVRLGDGAEAFLPGCVPDLQLHILVVYFQVLYLKVDSCTISLRQCQPAERLALVNAACTTYL